MSVVGIDEIVYRADDLTVCKQFFLDWGLRLLDESATELHFATLNDARITVVHASVPNLPEGLEEGPTLIQVIWGVESEADLDGYAQNLQNEPKYKRDDSTVFCQDPNGLMVGLQVSKKKAYVTECAQFNTWSNRPRLDQAAPAYDRAEPIDIGHVVLYSAARKAAVQFYVNKLGFAISDQYPDRGTFMRCAPRGGHHDLFLLQLPSGKAGLNHVAFTVRDIHEVFGGGLHFDRCGWKTQLGPGRHPISSAYFWYFENPAGGLVEYYADEDELTESWSPREFEPAPTMFAEWAVAEGIDGQTRRVKGTGEASKRFLTEKKT